MRKFDSKFILESIINGYASVPTNAYAWMPELRIGTGYGSHVESRIDLFVMSCWPSKSLLKRAYEIKISRSDLFNEIRTKPLKRRPGMLISNEFYFAIPKEMISDYEAIPEECGLVEVDELGKVKIVLLAPWREAWPPTWPMFASVLRRLKRGR